jgi:hypothetical protein
VVDPVTKRPAPQGVAHSEKAYFEEKVEENMAHALGTVAGGRGSVAEKEESLVPHLATVSVLRWRT